MEVRGVKWLKKIIPGVVIATLGLTSCRVLKPDKFPDLAPAESLYRDYQAGDSTNIADIPWNELFRDTLLQNLINSALQNNQDIRIALARTRKAEAGLIEARRAFFPSLSGIFNASFQSKNPNGFGLPESYQLLASTSWETGIWGKLRSSRKAALAAYYQSEAFQRVVRTELIATLAVNYFTLMAMDQKLRITEMTLERRIKNEETMKVMKENDIITGADLVLSQANRYSAEVTIPDLKQGIFELENTISNLTGKEPGTVERGILDSQDLSPELKPGIPAQLLANRPDVVEAEYRLRESFEMVKVARAGFYPSLRITASRGFAATNIADLFNAPVIVWNILGGITQPVFTAGLNRQRLIFARADQQEAFASFEKTLLSAGSEVVNALSAYKTATDKISIRSKQIEYLEKSVEYTNELLKYTNNTNYTDVLTAEVNLLSAQLNSVNDKLQQMEAVVSLYRSLGGGWKQVLLQRTK
jgi:NodT family efflux transporter outer membrane factor (OMF) lipoprotein